MSNRSFNTFQRVRIFKHFRSDQISAARARAPAAPREAMTVEAWSSSSPGLFDSVKTITTSWLFVFQLLSYVNQLLPPTDWETYMRVVY